MTTLTFVKAKPSALYKQTGEFFSEREIKLINSVLHKVEFKVELYFLTEATPEWILENTKSKIVICLGDSVSKSFVKEFTHYQYYWQKGKFILPLETPNEVLISPNKWFSFSNQLSKVLKLLELTKPEENKLDLKIFHSVAEALNILSELKGTLSADIETDGLNFMINHIIAFGLCDGKYQYIFAKELFYEEEFLKGLKDFLENSPCHFVWHNGKFDTKFFINYGINARMDEDTMLLHYIKKEQHGIHGLDYIASNYFNAPDYEQALKVYLRGKEKNYDHIPKDILYEYLGYDVYYTEKFFSLIRPSLDEREEKVYKFLMEANYYLRDMELNGLYVDYPYLKTLQKKLQTSISAQLEELNTLSEQMGFTEEGYLKTGAKSFKNNKFNPNSVPQIRHLIFDICGLPKYENTDTTNKDAREYWLNVLGYPKKDSFETAELFEKAVSEWEKEKPVNRFIVVFSEFKKLSKWDSVYVTGLIPLICPDGRIHPNFMLHGTETGRLSCKDPNLQNIPKEKSMKNLFMAEKGKALVEVDYSQAELRVLAVASDDPILKQNYIDGKDLHTAVASKIFKKPENEISKLERNMAKTVNFGLAYGRQAHSLTLMFDLNIREAEKLMADWFENMPVAGKFIKKTRLNHIEGRLVPTVFGRVRHYPIVTNANRNNIENESINTPIQSTASDLTLASGIKINKWLKEKHPEVKIVNTVHDSILIEIPDNEIYEVVKFCTDTMATVPKEVLHTDVPFVADAEIARHWGEKIDIDKIKDFTELK